MDLKLPKHIAIIMDGNGRWAKSRHLPRSAGHRAGVEAAHKIVEACHERGIQVLTLFAFSSENWRRPAEEVSFLMRLFFNLITRDIKKLHKNNVQFRVIGQFEELEPALCEKIHEAHQLTRANTGLMLQVAINYGAQAEIVQATKTIAEAVLKHDISIDQIDKDLFQKHLAFPDLMPPDLFIRPSGEMRISNFLLWHLAYAELYFTQTLWPDFDAKALDAAIRDYSKRQRRYGYTSEQLEKQAHA